MTAVSARRSVRPLIHVVAVSLFLTLALIGAAGAEDSGASAEQWNIRMSRFASCGGIYTVLSERMAVVGGGLEKDFQHMASTAFFAAAMVGAREAGARVADARFALQLAEGMGNTAISIWRKKSKTDWTAFLENFETCKASADEQSALAREFIETYRDELSQPQ